MYVLLLQIVFKVHSTATDTEIKDVVAAWLTGSCDMENRRKDRMGGFKKK